MMRRMETFDSVVVGLGAHGSAAAAELARRGLRVLGLERFGRGETYGSSGGRSRIIRLAHFENPAYAPLAIASWERWLALEAEAGAELLTTTGGLYAGPPESPVVRGAIETAAAHGLDHEILDAAAIRSRWPAFTPADNAVGVVEERAGVLRADRANEAHLRVAERAGARLRFATRVVDWRPAAGGGLEVETDDGTLVGAAHLVLTTGPWTADHLPDLALPLAVERQPVCWFTPVVPFEDVSAGRLPIWLMDTPDGGTFYGFPFDPELGLKVSHHHSGDLVAVETVDREVRPADVERIRSLPGPDAGRGRSAEPCHRLPLHEHAGRRVRHRSPSHDGGRRLRVGVLRARVQVRPDRRRDPRRPGHDGRDRVADRALPHGPIRSRLTTANLAGLSPAARVIAVALQRYGMILADNGSPWYVSGMSDRALRRRHPVRARSLHRGRGRGR